MAEKGWTAQVAAAAGVAAGTGAAQLGLGYGLGVVEWPAVPADDSVWLGSLGWATWIAASSTVFGAVIAGRLGRAVGGPWRFALAVSAAVGALLTVALIALPARAAVRTETFSPQSIAAGYAVIGILVGLFIAYWAVVSRPVAANLIATAAWLWSLAVAAVVTTIFWHRPSATYLSSWQFFSPDTADGQYGIIFWPSALLTLLAAFVVGVIGVLPASRRGDLGVGAAASGAVGPLLVAAAFVVLAPQLTGTPGPLQSAYLIAPYAVLAGLAGSALVVALGQRRTADRAADRAEGNRPVDGRTAGGTGPVAAAGESTSGADARLPRGRNARPTSDGPTAASSGRRAGTASGARGATVGGARGGTASGQGTASGRNARPAGGERAGATSEPTGPASGRTGKPISSGNAGNTTAVVPSPRPTPTDSPRDDAPAPGAPGPRKSFMDRFRRKGQDDAPAIGDQSAIATGRAKAPSAAVSPAPTGSGTAAHGKSPAAPSGSGAATPAKSPSARTPAARSGAPSVDGGARPAVSSAPGRSDSRSTVAPPPTSPPIAKINDPQSGEKPVEPRKSAARPGGTTTSGPTDAVASDKTPAARKTPAKATKATPKPAASGRRTTEDTTAELPVQNPQRHKDGTS